MDLGLEEIERARRRIEGVVYRTPLERSDWLSKLAGVPVHLKLECWQRTRSFKIRGAYNAVSMLGPGDRARGLVAASAGNHGQGVALAARELGARAVIFVPASAPETKKSRIRALGAELRMVEGIYDDAEAAALTFARERNAAFIHPFSDPAVVAGQGTVALEILEQMPDVEAMVVPVGGGGLCAGIGIVAKSLGNGRIRVIGVQSDATPAMHAAFEAGAVVGTEPGQTLADGLAGGVEPVSYGRARNVVDEMRLVPEAGIATAIRELYRRDGVVAEGAAAVPIAALQSGMLVPTGPLVLVISGGNIDGSRLASILGSG